MWLSYLRLAARALWGHKFRSALTVLSITVGAFAIVLMTSLADSGLQTIARGIEDLGGSRLIFIIPRQPDRAEVKRESQDLGVRDSDREPVFGALPHVVGTTVFARLRTQDTSTDLGRSARSDVVGSDSHFFDIFLMQLDRGRLFTEEEADAHAAVCVMGNRAALKLFSDNPIGHMVYADGVRCRVIGTLAEKDHGDVGFGFDWNDLIVMPRLTAAESDPQARFSCAMVKTDDVTANDTVKRIINARMNARHHGVDDFWILDFSTFMEKFHQIFAIMEILVGFIAGIALLIGGVGVMNIMLVSVSERVREIGIRKAIGARPNDIGAQFVTEAIFLAGSGGAIGVGFGVLFAMVAGRVIRHFLKSWVAVVSTPSAVIALLVSLAIGLIFGYFPARRASKLDPVIAMRR
ncbi:MAG: ABC transporter permease [Polyangiales bacterium]